MSGKAISVEVTDLYDAFHAVADRIWRDFHFRRHRLDEPESAPTFGELMDQLQLDLFLPACARRVLAETGIELDPDDVSRHLRLADAAGTPIAGDAGTFHYHGFDYGEPYEEGVENRVVSADHTTRDRSTVRLFVVADLLE